jgi:hypothetical protein
MQMVRFNEAEEYEPLGHRGEVDRLLTGVEGGGVQEVSVWHGLIDPGGGSDMHVHVGSVQVYVAISGRRSTWACP